MSKKVVVAMSGGVDSSVAAALLKEQGYDVYGVTMRLSDWQDTAGRTFGGCCGSKDFYDARSVAQTLGIPHYSFDYVEKFRGSVIGYFKDSYMKGETPNPCIACNKHVKFDALLEKAIALGADYVATGHYARIEAQSAVIPAKAGIQSHNGLGPVPHTSGGLSLPKIYKDGDDFRRGDSRRYALKKAVDAAKDQSYVLYNLGQKELARLLFPLGGLTKAETRDIARRAGLRTADKPDSYEICFVPNEDYRQFISEEVPAEKRPSGPIRHIDGRTLGTHKGLPFYTIGQREGLGVAVGSPLYVTALETSSNTLVVGPKEAVMNMRCTVRDLTWVSGREPEFPLETEAKIRSRHVPSPCTLSRVHAGEGEPDAQRRGSGEGSVAITFRDPQSAITPGQAAVFYQGDEVLGGGIIHRAD